jgi:hypothetical protein
MPKTLDAFKKELDTLKKELEAIDKDTDNRVTSAATTMP